jgi:hypothetical protein
LHSATTQTRNATLLTLLDGTSVYTVPKMIGKRLKSIEVQENSFQLSFFESIFLPCLCQYPNSATL